MKPITSTKKNWIALIIWIIVPALVYSIVASNNFNSTSLDIVALLYVLITPLFVIIMGVIIFRRGLLMLKNKETKTKGKVNIVLSVILIILMIIGYLILYWYTFRFSPDYF